MEYMSAMDWVERWLKRKMINKFIDSNIISLETYMEARINTLI